MRVGVRRGVRDMVRLVADRVVGVREEVCADLRRNDFAPVVVSKNVGVARRRAGEGVVCVRQRIDGRIVERRRNAVYEIAAIEVAGDGAADRVAAGLSSHGSTSPYMSSHWSVWKLVHCLLHVAFPPVASACASDTHIEENAQRSYAYYSKRIEQQLTIRLYLGRNGNAT